MKTKKEKFGAIAPFEVTANYIEIDSKSPLNVHDSHIHNECEIYINLSGDISFAVENSVYPVMTGGIIITRPFEYHHCIYHTDKLHRHYWILFQSENNKGLFDIFYKREVGKNNLLMLSAEKTKELFSVCRKLTEGCSSVTEKYYYFFYLINLLNSAETVNPYSNYSTDCVINAVNCINRDLSRSVSVSQIAQRCNVSVNTLERHFLKELNISPYAYLQKKRLANATRLLSEGYNVTEAAELSGFSDCSRFIYLFKKNYNMTPLKYKKDNFGF